MGGDHESGLVKVDCDRCPRCVFTRIGEGFLDGSVGALLFGGGEVGSQPRPGHANAHAEVPAFRNKVWDARNRGLGRVGGFRLRGGAEGVDGGTHVGKRLGNAGGNAFKLLFDGRGVAMQDCSCRSGLDGNAAEMVRGGVVKLAGDAGAFLRQEGLPLCRYKPLVIGDNVADANAEGEGCEPAENPNTPADQEAAWGGIKAGPHQGQHQGVDAGLRYEVRHWFGGVADHRIAEERYGQVIGVAVMEPLHDGGAYRHSLSNDTYPQHGNRSRATKKYCCCFNNVSHDHDGYQHECGCCHAERCHIRRGVHQCNLHHPQDEDRPGDNPVDTHVTDCRSLPGRAR